MFGKSKKKKVTKEELLDSIVMDFVYKDTVKDQSDALYRFTTTEKSRIFFAVSGKYVYAKNTLDNGGISFIKVTSRSLPGDNNSELIYHLNISEFLKYCDEFTATVMPTENNKNTILYKFRITYNTIRMYFSVYESDLYSSVQKHFINTALSSIYNKSL